MKSMVSGLFLLLATTASVPGGRHPSLDSLAVSILSLDSVPTGAALLRMSAAAGWIWPLGSVWLQPEPDGLPSDSPAWGLASGCHDRVCLVTAPAPQLTLGTPLPVRVNPGDTVMAVPVEGRRSLRAAVLSPGLTVLPLEDWAFRATDEGTWWLEFMADTDHGPQVLLLTPIDSGPPGAWPGGRWTRDELLPGINGLRRKKGVPALTESRFLNSLSWIRARQSRSWGGAYHSFQGSAATRDMIPESFGGWAENIATGADVSEAMEMILVSPFHLAPCIDGRYRYAGVGTASGPGGTVLVMILSENPGDE